MSDDIQPKSPAEAPQSGAPTMAGKMLIPDLTGLAVGQSMNIEAMVAVTDQAAATFQKIVTSQQSALVGAFDNMQKSVQKNGLTAGMSPEFIPDMTLQIVNMTEISQQFGQVAGILTATTTQSVDTLAKAVAQSMAKIAETAQKFSGG